MQATNLRRLMAVSLALVIAFSTFGAVFAQDDVKVIVASATGPDDIPTLDPAQATDTSSNQVINEIFPPMGRLHEENVIVEPGMATWEVSEDMLTWTISIMPEVPWAKYNADSGEVEQVFDADGNPRYVMAEDFANTIVRVMDPQIASDYGGIVGFWFEGGLEWNGSDPEASDEERQALIDALGVEVVDDYTLVLSPSAGTPVFESIIAMWVTTASPKWLVDEDPDFWIEPENIAAYGPFVVKDWVHDDSLTLIKNPFWPGTDVIPQAKIDEVVMPFLENSAALASYEAGELDFVGVVPVASLDRIRADATLSQELDSFPGTCSYYYGVNQNHPQLSDARLARALSYAIDRQAIIDNILRDAQRPAGFFTLWSMVAAPQQADYPEYAMLYNPEQAVAELEAYMADTGMTLEEIQFTLSHNTSETHAAIAQAVQQMWSETLGINAEIASQEWATHLATAREADMYRLGWCFDYPDTHNWLGEVWHSRVDPRNNYNNPEYDALVDAAFVAETVEERTELYAQAEQLLVQEDAALIPIYYYAGSQLVKPNVEATISVINTQYFEKWDLAE